MAFGIHPKFSQNIPSGLNSEMEVFLSAFLAAKEVGWTITTITSNGLCAKVCGSQVSVSENISIVIDATHLNITSSSHSETLTDNGHNKENCVKFGIYLAKYLAIKDVEIFEQAQTEISKTQNLGLKLTPLSKRAFKNSNGFRSFFIPQNGYFITPILIHLNFAIFILMLIFGYNPFAPNMEFLISWGANFRPATINGEWWRLITAVFLHANILHVVLNMLALAYVGMLLEPVLGKFRFVTAYFLTGLLASLCSFWWNDFTVSIGASGAIFGVFGVFLALLFTHLLDSKTRKQLLFSITAFIVVNLIIGFVEVGIDNAAHVGGLIGGFVVGFSFFPSLINPKNKNIKVISAFLVSVVFVFVSMLVYKNTPNDLPLYDTLIKDALWNETEAILTPEVEQRLTNDQIVKRIDVAKIVWMRAIKKVQKADQLNIPSFLHKRNKLQIDYYYYEIDHQELYKQKLIEGTTIYDEKMNKISVTLDSLRTEIEKYSSPQER